MQPNSPFLTPRSAEQWRRESVALPTPPAAQPAPSWVYRLAMWALWPVFVLVLTLVLGVLFVLFGQEPPQWVRPDLTTAERAKAFRIHR